MSVHFGSKEGGMIHDILNKGTFVQTNPGSRLGYYTGARISIVNPLLAECYCAQNNKKTVPRNTNITLTR